MGLAAVRVLEAKPHRSRGDDCRQGLRLLPSSHAPGMQGAETTSHPLSQKSSLHSGTASPIHRAGSTSYHTPDHEAFELDRISPNSDSSAEEIQTQQFSDLARSRRGTQELIPPKVVVSFKSAVSLTVLQRNVPQKTSGTSPAGDPCPWTLLAFLLPLPLPLLSGFSVSSQTCSVHLRTLCAASQIFSSTALE